MSFFRYLFPKKPATHSTGSLSITPWWLPRVLNSGLHTLTISERGLAWFGSGRSTGSFLSLEKIAVARCHFGIISTEVAIVPQTTSTGPHSTAKPQTLRFSGFTAARASDFVALVSSLASGARLHELASAIDAALHVWNHPDGKDQFLSAPLLHEWRLTHSILCAETQQLLGSHPPDSEVRKRGAQLVEIWTTGETARTSRNSQWMSRQRDKHADLFNRAMGYPLNDDQINAILRDEHRSLIVAGAGTGKTTTVVAKTKWIIGQRLAAPDRIRILAFNKKAARDIADRLRGEAGTESIASTFHSLGLSLVAQGRSRKPRLTRLVEDKRLLQRFIRSCLDEALNSPTQCEKVAQFLFFFRYPEPNPVPTRGSHEELRFAEGHSIRTLTGVKVRSNSEAAIANWLTLNGVKWEYEPRYQLDTATPQFGQYHPDFFLPEYGIYIEHWSCTSTGQFPPNWSAVQQQEYRDAMSWKREVHERNGTRLVETYSSRLIWRDVVKALERQLLQLGVIPSPLNDNAQRALLETDSIISPVVTLLERFLALFRESDLSISDLYSDTEGRHDDRGKAFVAMFEVIHERFVSRLRTDGTIDYSEMIREATSLLREGKAQLPIDYLVVDEFQDISRGRADFIKAILATNDRCRLVAVGDDWQSINRFAGSDIRLMLEFESEFGATTRSDLRQTQRFGGSLLAATSKFIEMNPRQLRKKLIAARKDDAPAVEIMSSSTAGPTAPLAPWPAPSNQSAMQIQDRDQNVEYVRSRDRLSFTAHSAPELLDNLLRQISVEREKSSVLVLGRYNYLLRDIEEQVAIPSNVSLSFSTVHRAKGLEADFVVVLAVVAGPYGFPSEIEDDSLLDLLLPGAADYPNAEERRLFYVALTRARFKAFVITRDENRSAFAEELTHSDYAGLVIRPKMPGQAAPCPVCGGGTLILRKSKHGPYFRCAHDRCPGKAQKCPRCGAGAFVRGPTSHQCLVCSYTLDNCPNCKRGYLKHIPSGVSRDRGRPFDAFDACSTNRREEAYICFTRKCACS